jgi:hypothetical protein
VQDRSNDVAIEVVGAPDHHGPDYDKENDCQNCRHLITPLDSGVPPISIFLRFLILAFCIAGRSTL